MINRLLEKVRFYFRSFIVGMYRKYVNAIYVPKGTEFYLNKSMTATVDPQFVLWIIHRKISPHVIKNFGKPKYGYGTDEYFYHWSMKDV